MDVFSLRLTDRNSKVNLHALQAFSSMVPVLRGSLVAMMGSIMTTLIPNLASRNLTIHSTAMTVLDLMSQHIGKCQSYEKGAWELGVYSMIWAMHISSLESFLHGDLRSKMQESCNAVMFYQPCVYVCVWGGPLCEEMAVKMSYFFHNCG